MKFRQHSLRKAAILVASLDSPTADLLLAQMGSQQADRVRHAILRLSDVDPAEQNEIIEEFFRIGPLIPQKHPPGIELDDELARRIALPSLKPEKPVEPEPEPSSDEPPFRFLHETEFETLAPFLKREQPQTIAVVLSHLPPDRAGEVLAQLPPTVQVEVIRRLVDLDEADPRVLREVERGLESWLSEQVRDRRRRAAGLAAVSAILTAASGGTRRSILTNLTRHDRTLAGKLRPDRFHFADMIELDDATVLAVMKAADPELIVLALAGARAELVQRITRQLPIEQGRALNKALVHLGPTRLADVEEAQQALADLAVDLEAEGRITLGANRRISVAA
jgi:flagellar motor switch protein FliG